MSVFNEVVERINQLSAAELEEIKTLVDKELIGKRIEELEGAIKEAKKHADNGKLSYYKTGEDLIASLNED